MSDYSDFEQRRALQRFHELATQDNIEIIRDQWNRKEDAPILEEMGDLCDVFSNANKQQQNEYDHFVVGALRRRDAAFLNMIAEEMYKPDSQLTNPIYLEKLRKISEGRAKIALRLVF